MKKSFAYIFILIGIVSVILGTVCYSMETGQREFHYSYGGDAYTGIQNGVAQTANNVKYLTEVTAFGFGSVLTVGGVFMLVFGIKNLSAAKKSQQTGTDTKDEGTAADTENAAQETK